jgi:hypothetical protein
VTRVERRSNLEKRLTSRRSSLPVEAGASDTMTRDTTTTERDATRRFGRRDVLKTGGLLVGGLALGVGGTGTALAGKGNDKGKQFGLIWANDVPYTTNVVKPLDRRPKNEDKLYFIHDGSQGLQPAVSETAPGDTDYNGGKWTHFNARVTNMTKYQENAPLTNDADVLAADGDYLDVSLGRPDFEAAPPNYFLCPLTGVAKR